MPLGSSFTYADYLAATQTCTRKRLLPNGGAVYENDTKKAAGHREEITFEVSEFSATDDAGNKVPMVRNVVQIERKLSTDAVPTRRRTVETIPRSNLSAITTARNLFKDFNALETSISSTDAKIDDLVAGRAHVP